jgi:tetratricopeptide (TPR) repeat protein
MLQPLKRMLLICIVFCVSGYAAHASEQFDADYTIGVEALNQGDYKQATKLFGSIVKQDPTYKRARYYLGVSYSRTSKYKKALQLFKEDIASNPLSETFLQAGIANLNMGDGSAAVSYLDKAVQGFSGRSQDQALALFYLGLAKQQLSDYQASLLPLQQAGKLDQAMSAPAGYYAAVSMQALGQESEAIAKLEEIRQKGASPEYEKKAAELIRQIETGFGDQERKYSLNATIGFQYDTNVILEPDTIEVSEEDDFRGVVVLGGAADFDWLRASYGFYQSIHLELDGFNVQNHRLALDSSVKSDLRGQPITYGVRSVTNGALLSNSLRYFSFNSSVEPYLTRPINSIYSIHAKFAFQYEDFRSQDSQRDNFNYGLVLSHLINLADGRLFLGIRSGLHNKDADRAFDLWRLFSDAQITFDARYFTVGAQGAFMHDVYARNLNNCEDNRYDVGGSISRGFLEHYLVTASYQRSKVSSNQFQFDYTRQIPSLTIGASF